MNTWVIWWNTRFGPLGLNLTGYWVAELKSENAYQCFERIEDARAFTRKHAR